MQSTTIAVDTAKLVFEVVVSDGHRVIENHRLNRAEFQAFIVHQPPSRFVMEACGGSHHWARLMLAISKRGDKYVRTLLIHGTRTVLLGARRNENAGRPLSPLQQWALGVQARSNHNKAACAVANKLARIAWASWANGTCFDANYQAIAA